jgi:glucokinase
VTAPQPLAFSTPLVGLDIGGTNIKGVVLAPDGAVLAQHSIPTMRGPEGVVASATQMVDWLLTQAGVAADELGGIGIGIPGLVDSATGVINHAVNLGITDVPLHLAEKLTEIYGKPVVVDNDLNVAALGTAFLSPSLDGSVIDLAFLSLGTGVAGGFVLDGKLRQGYPIAGEIGHIPIDANGPLCNCGQRGCLELYSSGSALEKLWPAEGELPGPAALLRAAQAGDARAVGLLNGFYLAVATGVRNLILSLGPKQVVIGGGVTRLGEPLLVGVRSALDTMAADSPFLQSLRMADRVSLIAPGEPVAAIGAAVLVRDSEGVNFD